MTKRLPGPHNNYPQFLGSREPLLPGVETRAPAFGSTPTEMRKQHYLVRCKSKQVKLQTGGGGWSVSQALGYPWTRAEALTPAGTESVLAAPEASEGDAWCRMGWARLTLLFTRLRSWGGGWGVELVLSTATPSPPELCINREPGPQSEADGDPKVSSLGHSWLPSRRPVAAGTWASRRPFPAQADSPSRVSSGCAGAQASPAGRAPVTRARSPGQASAADTCPCPLPDSQSRRCLRPGEEPARAQKGRGSAGGRAGKGAGGGGLPPRPRPRFVPGRPSASPARVLVVGVTAWDRDCARAHRGLRPQPLPGSLRPARLLWKGLHGSRMTSRAHTPQPSLCFLVGRGWGSARLPASAAPLGSAAPPPRRGLSATTRSVLPGGRAHPAPAQPAGACEPLGQPDARWGRVA